MEFLATMFSCPRCGNHRLGLLHNKFLENLSTIDTEGHHGIDETSFCESDVFINPINTNLISQTNNSPFGALPTVIPGDFSQFQPINNIPTDD